MGEQAETLQRGLSEGPLWVQRDQLRVRVLWPEWVDNPDSFIGADLLQLDDGLEGEPRGRHCWSPLHWEEGDDQIFRKKVWPKNRPDR